jgi:hypothetical protein
LSKINITGAIIFKILFKKNTITVIFLIFLLSGCSLKQPIVSQSATIIFKTPTMKFYDKGFITKYEDYIHLQILNIGVVVLNLKIYENMVCQDTLECLDNKEFNLKYLSKNYDDKFLYNLFSKEKNIRFKDKKSNIFIKVKKD